MENVLELIKNSKSFKKYVKLVKENDSLPSSREIETEMKLKSLDFEDALLGLANIEQVDDGFRLHMDSWVGTLVSDYGEKTGNASYDVLLKNENDDVIINGNIIMVFNNVCTLGFDERGSGVNEEINEVAVNEKVNEVLKDKGSILNSRRI